MAALLGLAERQYREHIAPVIEPLKRYATRVGLVFLLSYIGFGLLPLGWSYYAPMLSPVGYIGFALIASGGFLLMRYHSRLGGTTLVLMGAVLDLWVAGYSADGWFGHSSAAAFVQFVESYLVPRGETILVLAPFESFTVLMEAGAFLALLVTIPAAVAMLLPRLWRYGLWEHERRLLRWLLPGIPALFLAGAGLALFLLPWLYAWGLGLDPAVGAQGTVQLSSLMTTTVVFTASVGLVFEAPVLAAAAAYVGILSGETLISHWRMALLASGGIAFVISPGVGGGIIEIPLVGVFFGIYLLSWRVVRRVERASTWRQGVAEAA